MKELSIEEKAKAYDEVVNKLKGFMTQGVDPLITRADAQDFFPELKESEDERIRGNIIATIHLYYGEPLEDEAKEMIAWLEKQGEHDVYKESFNDGYKLGYREASENIQEEPEKYGLCKIEKQGEQKPAWSEEDEQYLLVCKNALAKYQVSDKWDAIIISRWLEDKLKSLRPQNWRPSDEQMRVLDLAIRCGINRGTTEETTLVSLFNDLKKLK